MKFKLFTLFICVVQASFVQAQNTTTTFDKEIADMATSIICNSPSSEDPLALEGRLIKDKNSDSIAVIIKIKLAEDWHIYASFPENMPYILTEHIINPDKNSRLIGSWQKSKAVASKMDSSVMLYEGEAIFIHKLKRLSPDSGGKITAGLSYQCCDAYQCHQPVDKTVELIY